MLSYVLISVVCVLIVSSMAHDIIHEAHHQEIYDVWYKRPQVWCISLTVVLTGTWGFVDDLWSRFGLSTGRIDTGL